MPVTVHIPTSLREFCAGQSRLAVEVGGSATLRDVLGCVHQSHPGVVERVLDERGGVRPHVNVFVDGDSIRLREGLQTRVEPNAEVWIIPAVSGG